MSLSLPAKVKSKRKEKQIMKRLFTLMTVALSLLMMTSCDEDAYEARILSGQWTGDMGMYYDEANPRTGRVARFYADYTDIVFYPDYDYATKGYGKQVDYYKWASVTHMYFYFYWEIRDGRIYLSYPYDPNLSAIITNYRISEGYFNGRIGNTSFNLYKIVDYYDWGYYNGYGNYYDWSTPYWDWNSYGGPYYDYDPYDPYYRGTYYPYDPYNPYYSKTRSDEATDSIAATSEKPVRRVGNRFMDEAYGK